MPLSSITAVRPTASTGFVNVIYGTTISAGQAVYKDATASDKHKLADADLSDAGAAAVGIAITPGIDEGYGLIAKSGSIILVGTTMVVGETYYVSRTAGSIIATSELVTGDRVTRLGTAATTTQLDLSIKATGIVRA